MFNVLLVDDEIVAVNALLRRVDWGQYQIASPLVALSMAQAKDHFAIHRIDLMLCDIEMPKGSGLELFEWVKLHHPQTECVFVTCHPDFDYVRKAMQLGSLDYVLKPIDYEELGAVLRHAIKRLNNKSQLSVRAGNVVLEKIVARESDQEGPDMISQVRQYILDHISETIYIEDIAKAVHLNAQYLMRLFKKETGVPILEHITAERMRIAQDLLLQTDLSVHRIAESVGYENHSYFIKMIRRYTGMTPASFRRKHQAGGN